MIHQKEFEMILELGRIMQREHSLDAILGAILETAMGLTHCDAGTIYLKEDHFLYFGCMRNHSLTNCNDIETSKLPPVPIDRKYICSFALLEEKTIVVDDAYEKDGNYDFTGMKNYDQRTGYRTKSVLVVPLFGRRGVPVGVFQLINAKNESSDSDNELIIPFSKEDIQLVEYLAPQAALEIQNTRYQNEIDSLMRIILVAQKPGYSPDHTEQEQNLAAGIYGYLQQSLPDDMISHYLLRDNLENGIKKVVQTHGFEKKFLDTLKSYVYDSGLKDAEIAERCMMNRATFSGLLNGRRTMKRKHLLAICISLSLGLKETSELLELNGERLRSDKPEDRIIQFYIYYHEAHDILKQMSVMDLNRYLDEYRLPLLGENSNN